MQAVYRLDLREVCYGPGRIGLRRLRALIRGLPPKGAVHRFLDEEGWAWGVQEELLAAAIEVIDLGNRQYIASQYGRSKVPEPIQIRRPSTEKAEPKRMASHEEIMAFFGQGSVN